MYLSSVLVFLAVLAVIAGGTAAAIAEEGIRGRPESSPFAAGDFTSSDLQRPPPSVYSQDVIQLTSSLPECQIPSADDLSVLLEAVAGRGTVSLIDDELVLNIFLLTYLYRGRRRTGLPTEFP